MIFLGLFFRALADAFLLALGIAVAHFIIIGSAIGQTNFFAMLPICFMFAIANLVVRMMEIHKTLKNRE
jgi:hypothetical protein